MEFHNINKILVIKLRNIGDVLLTVPVFRALRGKFPNAGISALVNSGTEEVLTGNPLIDDIIVFDRKTKEMPVIRKYIKEYSFLKILRKKGFDLTVDLTGGDRAAIISCITGARYRLGWKFKKGFIGKRFCYTYLSLPDAGKHMVLQNLAVVQQVGIVTNDFSVDFYDSNEDKAFIKKILKEHDIAETADIVHIHPTSRWLFKCWKDEYMAEIIRWLIGNGFAVIVTSSADRREVEKTKKILSLVGYSPRVIDLSARTTIKQLGSISRICGLFFGVDTAPMHIAAAVNTPVVALFGPSGAFHWGPWENSKSIESNESKAYQKRSGVQTFGIHTVIQRTWDCIPCGNDGCNGSKISKCLDDIKPEEVLDVIRKVIHDREHREKKNNL